MAHVSLVKLHVLPMMYQGINNTSYQGVNNTSYELLKERHGFYGNDSGMQTR